MKILLDMILEADEPQMKQVKGTDLAPGLYAKVLELKRLNDKLLEMQDEIDKKLLKISSQLGYEKPADKEKTAMVKDIKTELLKQNVNAVELRDILLRLEPKRLQPSAQKLIDSVVNEVSADVRELLKNKAEMLTTINYELHFRDVKEAAFSFISNAFKSIVDKIKNLTSSFTQNVRKLNKLVPEKANESNPKYWKVTWNTGTKQPDGTFKGGREKEMYLDKDDYKTKDDVIKHFSMFHLVPDDINLMIESKVNEEYNDVTKMPVIGKVITKPIEGINNNTGEKVVLPSETREIVDIVHGNDGKKIYVGNTWYKEHKRIPHIYIEDLVQEYIPIDKTNESMKEANIDFPKPELSELVWDKTEDGSYVLKPDVEQKIYDVISKYPQVNLLDKVKEIHVVGSIGTNQYDDTSDIDVHLIYDKGSFPDTKTDEDWQKDIKKWYKDNRDSFDSYVGSHPIEVYYQTNPAQEEMAEAYYNVKEKKWIKGPKIVEPDFNPYSKYKSIVDDLQDVLGETDVLMGELKRDVIDYDVIKKAIEDAPADVKRKLIEILQNKVKEIESNIDELLKNKKEWIDMRKQSSSPITKEQAYTDMELMKKWDNANALFKFIDRYQYMQLIGELEKMMEDESISDEEAQKILKMLSSTSGAIK